MPSHPPPATTETRLEHRSWFWPVALFPHSRRSHTLTWLGLREGRIVWFKDVVFQLSGRLELTPEVLRCRGNLVSLWSRLEIDRAAIESVRPSPKGDGLLEVRFREASKTRLLRYLTRGPLDGVVLLNLGADADAWHRELARGSGAH
jgi:hypothetical protein